VALSSETAQIMRNILVDYARMQEKGALARGAGS
jgi:hypothetical protein